MNIPDDVARELVAELLRIHNDAVRRGAPADELERPMRVLGELLPPAECQSEEPPPCAA
jgi:hypothetical protein